MLTKTNFIKNPKILIGLAALLAGIFLAKAGIISGFMARFDLDQQQTDQKASQSPSTQPTASPSTLPLAGSAPGVNLTPPANFSEPAAFKLATSKTSVCATIGDVSDPEAYNPNSQTWWFTIIRNQPAYPKTDGCHPACVVHLDGQTEINWRCTGLKIP